MLRVLGLSLGCWLWILSSVGCQADDDAQGLPRPFLPALDVPPATIHVFGDPNLVTMNEFLALEHELTKHRVEFDIISNVEDLRTSGAWNISAIRVIFPAFLEGKSVYDDFMKAKVSALYTKFQTAYAGVEPTGIRVPFVFVQGYVENDWNRLTWLCSEEMRENNFCQILKHPTQAVYRLVGSPEVLIFSTRRKSAPPIYAETLQENLISYQMQGGSYDAVRQLVQSDASILLYPCTNQTSSTPTPTFPPSPVSPIILPFEFSGSENCPLKAILVGDRRVEAQFMNSTGQILPFGGESAKLDVRYVGPDVTSVMETLELFRAAQHLFQIGGVPPLPLPHEIGSVIPEDPLLNTPLLESEGTSSEDSDLGALLAPHRVEPFQENRRNSVLPPRPLIPRVGLDDTAVNHTKTGDNNRSQFLRNETDQYMVYGGVALLGFIVGVLVVLAFMAKVNGSYKKGYEFSPYNGSDDIPTLPVITSTSIDSAQNRFIARESPETRHACECTSKRAQV